MSNEINWRHKSLPDHFKVFNKKTEGKYTCERISKDQFHVGWMYNGSSHYKQVYGESTLKEIIFKDKAWEIMEDKLPAQFKFEASDAKEYTATKCADGSYHVTWKGCGNGLNYLALDVSAFVSRGRWEILEEPAQQCPSKQIVSLQDIQEFCKECSAEIAFAYIHGEPRYDVYYSDSEVAQAESDEGLMEIMKAIRVLYGTR